MPDTFEITNPTKRQQIVDAMLSRTRTISVANGYTFDYKTIADWRTDYNEKELPAISVCDLPSKARATNPNGDDYTKWDMPVQWRIFVNQDTRPEVLRAMIGDVNKMIRTDPRWSIDRVIGVPPVERTRSVGLAMLSEPMEEGFIIPDENFVIAGAAVQINVVYRTQTFNAYDEGVE